MKKMFNKSISISFITILFIIIISSLSSCFAATTTVGELWDKCAISGTNYDVYCTQPTTQFIENSSYNVGDKYEVVGNIVKKNGTVVAPGTDEYKYALKMAYILATPDTALSKSSIDNKINSWKSSLTSEQRRSIYNGIYDLTSIRQTAIWLNFSGRTKWNSSGTVLKYDWYLGAPGESYGDNHFTIVKNSDGTYSFSDYDGGYVHGTYENIGDMKFSNGSGNSQGYYAAAVELKNNANSYTGVSSEIENKTSGVLNPDYSNASYIQIGPIKLEHNSALTLSTSVEVYDKAGNRINGATMVKSSRSYGSEIYIRINKSGSLPLNISKVKIEYSVPNSANSTWYKLYKTNSQNLVAGKGSFSSSTGEYEIDLDIDLVPPIQIKLEKVDTKGNKVSGPKFKVEYSNGLSSETKTVTGGQITFTKRTPANLDAFTATITETDAGSGYKLLSDPIVLQFTYNSGKWNVSKKSGPEENTTLNTSVVSGTSEVKVRVENKSKIDELTILKTEAQDGSYLEGALFDITLTNIESIGHYSSGNPEGKIILKNSKTDGNGKITLKDLVISDSTKPIYITIKEIATSSENYKLINGEIKLTLQRNGNELKLVSVEEQAEDSEFKSNDVKINGNTIKLDIKNLRIITLAGQVWLDEQEKAKGEIKEADGEKDTNEPGVDGVIVYLCNKYGVATEYSTKTSGGGYYEFKDIPAGEYQVKFEYNGIWYDDVGNRGDSKAAETNSDRQGFNNRFITISDGQSNDQTPLSYTYNEDQKISKLNTDVNGNNPASKEKNFKITAQTEATNYRNDTQNINCGLIEKYLDLAIGTDVKEAEVSINGKTTKYNYKQIMDGDLDKISSSRNDVEYNLYLYESDYNYRISDYKTDGSIANKMNPNDASKINPGSELEAKVTYTVILKNQSKHNARIDEFVYYYDAENYEPLFNDQYSTNGYKIKSIEGNKITFVAEGEANILSHGNDYRKELDIPFKVKKDNINTSDNYSTNIVEITKYSTIEGGLIDDDSEPNNGIVNGKITQYEDDTDESKGINIKIAEGKIRTITGKVWDDGEKNSADGKLDTSNEKVVDDVIVQLIEVKNISGVGYCEYIWQETRSGSEYVKKLSSDGNQITEVKYSENTPNGEYTFTGFIPGNYIIRFIYGDGQTYDVTPNVEKYNGQDYQSTINSKYKASWYNTTTYEGHSVAKDNEARRLEVMAYSTKIDKDIGKALKDKTALSETWMCAETSRINIPVDADDTKTDSDSTGSTDSSQTIKFDNINFGLALRPQTKLKLEKHITSLKIVPTGVGSAPVVDARVNIKDVMDGTISEKITGVTDGLAAVASDRNNRGFWKVATDIEELAQGAKIEVEYTYVIVNDSDKDYLSSNLVNIYKNNISVDIDGDGDLDNNYPVMLNQIKDTVKNTMRDGSYAYKSNPVIGTYLGEYYYTGNEDGCTEVLSSVDGIEESLNEQFGQQDNVGDYFDAYKVTNTTPDVLRTYIDTDGNIASRDKNISTVLKSKKGTDFLTIKGTEGYKVKEGSKLGNTDWSRTVRITTVLSSVTNGEIGGNFPSYIAEMTSYTNAAGRRNMNGTPGDLSYVHSEDTAVTLDNSWKYVDDAGNIKSIEQSETKSVPGATKVEKLNGLDEFWGETIIISKPEGEDKLTGIQIAIITTISVAILGVGIVLIKKLVLKK